MFLATDFFFKQYKNQKKRFIFKIPMFFFLVLLLVSCGKKGPPMLPEMLSLPEVTDLEAKILSDTIVELSWTLPVTNGVPLADGFRIYRSKKAIETSECPGCPDEFERVADRETDFKLLGRPETRYSYRETIERGYRYRYKIIAYTQNGVKSNWSNMVRVEVKSRGTL